MHLLSKAFTVLLTMKVFRCELENPYLSKYFKEMEKYGLKITGFTITEER